MRQRRSSRRDPFTVKVWSAGRSRDCDENDIDLAMIGWYMWRVRSSLSCALLLLTIASGCTWVYDSQYDDRANELEAFRTEFLPGSDQVQFISGAEGKLFWVSLEKPLDDRVMHSYDPSTDTRIDYTNMQLHDSLQSDSNFDQHYFMSNTLFVKCSFGTSTAYDATVPDRLIAQTSMGDDSCAVDGGTVYFVVAGEIRSWVPGNGEPVTRMVLAEQGVGDGSIGGFAVLGDDLLLSEGPRLWLIDLQAGTATWLENEDSPQGTVVFDARGVVYDSSPGLQYVLFADHSVVNLEAAIDDGGYQLNLKHEEVHKPQDGAEYVLHGAHLVYRSTRGIFAYGLESKKVVDLLLDRGESFDAKPVYRSPVVTSDGTLFVMDDSSLGGGDRPVYRVDLNGRLR